MLEGVHSGIQTRNGVEWVWLHVAGNEVGHYSLIMGLRTNWMVLELLGTAILSWAAVYLDADFGCLIVGCCCWDAVKSTLWNYFFPWRVLSNASLRRTQQQTTTQWEQSTIVLWKVLGFDEPVVDAATRERVKKFRTTGCRLKGNWSSWWVPALYCSEEKVEARLRKLLEVVMVD